MPPKNNKPNTLTARNNEMTNFYEHKDIQKLLKIILSKTLEFSNL
jgi:hypothetical protein